MTRILNSISDDVAAFINACIASDEVSVLIYRLPDTYDYCLALSHTQENLCLHQLKDLPPKAGFIFAPFHVSKQSPIHFCPSFVHLKGIKVIEEYVSHIKLKEQPPIRYVSKDINSTSAETYRKIFASFMQPLKKGDLKKVVLSCKSHVNFKNTDLASVFEHASHCYPHLTTYLCGIDNQTIWMGCTPEILVKGAQGKYETMALAGTFPITDQPIIWNLKNKQEQRYVAEYIHQVLKEMKLDVKVGETQTLKAGGVVHLCTKFQFQLKAPEQLALLINQLHPTPAVCGLPKQEAMQYILDNEGYQRDYYAGFLGWYDPFGETELYVNLRCAQIDDTGAMCYGGGGILPTSTVEDEWHEAQYKMDTIKKLFIK